MNILKIDPISIANGPGVRVAVFVAGCKIHCENCHNRTAWDFNAGTPLNTEACNEIIGLLQRPWCAGLSILGGEPLDPRNISGVHWLICQIRKALPEASIWLYTGYELDGIIRKAERTGYEPGDKVPASCRAAWEHRVMDVIRLVNVVVDGPFVQKLHSPDLAFRGSRNQRFWIQKPDGWFWTYMPPETFK